MSSETIQSNKDKSAVKKENPAKLRRRSSAKIDGLLWRLKARLESRSEGAHVIGITSCCPGSGVTTTIANLAIRAADHHLGPVLLIDANSVRPRQHRQFKLSPKTGLANILVGSTAPSEAILQTKITGLDLLPMGDASLLEKSRIMPENHVELMQWVSRNYSMVFVDLPQIENLRHTLLIAKANDLTLVAVRSDSVPRDEVTGQIEQLVSDGVEVAGTLLTRRRIYTPRIFRR